MNWMINEVQITYTIIMTLNSIILGFVIPHHIDENRLTKHARQVLCVGTSLTAIHFFIQYLLHKNCYVDPELRTIINILFGIPTSFAYIYPLLYLQRNGHVKKWEYLFTPIAGLLAYTVFALTMLPSKPFLNVKTAIIMTGFTYWMTHMVYYVLLFKDFLRIRKNVKLKLDLSQKALFRWSRWPMFLQIIAGSLLPFFIIDDNIVYRSLSGLFVISTSFYYIWSFIGYILTSYSEKPNALEQSVNAKQRSSDKDINNGEQTEALDEEKLTHIERAAANMIENRFYLNAGITIKDVANEMGISRNSLNAWLQTTEYKKFTNWLTLLRIEEAKRLLKSHPNWSNETIAKSCGFGDRSYFQRQFNEIVGTSPAKWSKEQEAEGNLQE